MSEFPRYPTTTSMLVTSSSIQKWLWPGLVQGQLYVAKDLNIESIRVIVYFGEEMPLFKEKIFMESLRWNQELLLRLEFFSKGLSILKC